MADDAIMTPAEIDAELHGHPLVATPEVTVSPEAEPDRPATPAELSAAFGAPPGEAPPVKRSGGFLDNAWHSIVGLGSDVLGSFENAYTNADKPAITQPVEAPLLSGGVRGVRDVIDKPAEGLAWLFGQGGATAARDAADRAAYEKQYGESGTAKAGRFGGQMLATIPAAAKGIGLLGEAGAALTRAAPWLESIVSPTSAAGRLVANTVKASGEGAAIGGGTAALTAEPGHELEDAAEGAKFGAVAGPVTAGIGAVARPVYNAVTGLSAKVQSSIGDLATLARTYGIDVPASSLSKNPLTNIGGDFSRQLPFSGSAAAREQNITNWRRAVARTMGEDSDTLGPQTMTKAANRLKTEFDGAAQQTSIPVYTDPNMTLLTDLGVASANAQRNMVNPAGAQKIADLVHEIVDTAGKHGGTIPGEQYLALTKSDSTLGQLLRSESSDVRLYAAKVQQALDHSLDTFAPAGLKDQIQTARLQFRNMKTVEDALTRSNTGELEPATLWGPAKQHSDKYDSTLNSIPYAGGSELDNLARIGNLFLAPAKTSGSAEKGALAAGVAAGTEVLGQMVHDPLAGLVHLGAAGSALAGNRALQSYLRSPWLTNRMIAPMPQQGSVLRALPYTIPAERGLLGDAGQ